MGKVLSGELYCTCFGLGKDNGSERRDLGFTLNLLCQRNCVHNQNVIAKCFYRISLFSAFIKRHLQLNLNHWQMDRWHRQMRLVEDLITFAIHVNRVQTLYCYTVKYIVDPLSSQKADTKI